MAEVPAKLPDAGTAEDRSFRSLQELTRKGYVPDATAPVDGEGLVMRHQSAADIVLRPDGSIELSADPADPIGAMALQKPVRKRRWTRLLLILAALAAYTFLVFLIIGMIAG